MSLIAITLHDLPSVILQNHSQEQRGFFAGLSRLLDCTESVDTVLDFANVTFEAPFQKGEKAANFRNTGLAVTYDREKRSFRAAPGTEPLFSGAELQSYTWQLLVLLGIVSAMLRGSKILPIHGALLSVRDGGLLLCGESGVGKSTTARRWQEAGGDAPADDMLLLEYGGDRLLVHPLPTWSRCAVSADGLCYPVNRVIPLVGVMGIARGEKREEILPVSESEFFAQLYSSSLFFIKPLAAAFKGEERNIILSCVREAAEAMVSKFPPQALFAHLEEDLRKTLEEYL